MVAAVALWAGGSETARAGTFAPISQLREVRSDTIDATRGYTCLGGGGGPPLPSCPTDLGTTTPSDIAAATDFAAFDETAATPGGSATQTSSITPTSLMAIGQNAANATASVLPNPPCCLFVLRTVDPTTVNTYQVTVALDAATAFTLTAGGWVEHPDPSFPVNGQGSLDISFKGPSGALGSFHASYDPGCSVQPTFGICRVEPAPLALSGTLPAGTYTLDIVLEASSAGSWFPSVGALSGYGVGAYQVALDLEASEPPPVPGLGPIATGALVAVLAALGSPAARGRCSPRRSRAHRSRGRAVPEPTAQAIAAALAR